MFYYAAKRDNRKKCSRKNAPRNIATRKIAPRKIVPQKIAQRKIVPYETDLWIFFISTFYFYENFFAHKKNLFSFNYLFYYKFVWIIFS